MSAVLGAVTLVSSGGALAYGPPFPPPGPPGPGAYNCVVTSRQVDPVAGGVIGPLQVGELLVEVRVPAHTFPRPVQVTLTDPYSPSGACQSHPAFRGRAFRGDRLIGGVGILVGLPGVFYGRFPGSVTLSLEPDINAHEFQSEDIASAGGALIEQVSGARSHRPVTLSADDSPEFFVLVRSQHWLYGHGVARWLHGSAIVPATEVITAALLPAGSLLPGLGVLAPGVGGSMLGTADPEVAGR
jgi:hypothetical protein